MERQIFLMKRLPVQQHSFYIQQGKSAWLSNKLAAACTGRGTLAKDTLLPSRKGIVGKGYIPSSSDNLPAKMTAAGTMGQMRKDRICDEATRSGRKCGALYIYIYIYAVCSVHEHTLQHMRLHSSTRGYTPTHEATRQHTSYTPTQETLLLARVAEST